MMNFLDNWMEPYLYFVIRTSLGLLFFFQAYDKIMRLGLGNILIEVRPGCTKRNIPDWVVRASVFSSSYLELIGGALLILGLFQLPVLYIFGIHMIILIGSFSFLKGLWDMQHVFPRLILLILLMVLPEQWNHISLDTLLF